MSYLFLARRWLNRRFRHNLVNSYTMEFGPESRKNRQSRIFCRLDSDSATSARFARRAICDADTLDRRPAPRNVVRADVLSLLAVSIDPEPIEEACRTGRKSAIRPGPAHREESSGTPAPAPPPPLFASSPAPGLPRRFFPEHIRIRRRVFCPLFALFHVHLSQNAQ